MHDVVPAPELIVPAETSLASVRITSARGSDIERCILNLSARKIQNVTKIKI